MFLKWKNIFGTHIMVTALSTIT